MLRIIRNPYITKAIAVKLTLLLLTQISLPTVVVAQGGPDAVNAIGSADGISQLVNPATGDFSYSIPLFNVDGYPMNLNYTAGIKPDQQASWVGLGWSLTPGAISRHVKGMPDDFDGTDQITREFNFKKRSLYGLNLRGAVEYVGLKTQSRSAIGGVSLSGGIRYDNYTGINTSIGGGASIGIRTSLFGGGFGAKGKVGGGFNFDTQGGLSLSKFYQIGLSANYGGASINGGFRKSSTYSFLTDQKNTNSSFSLSVSDKNTRSQIGPNGGLFRRSSRIGSVYNNFPLDILMPTTTKGVRVKAGFGMELSSVFPHAALTFYTEETKIKDPDKTFPGFGFLYLNKANGHENEILDYARFGDKSFSNNIDYLPTATLTYDEFNATASGLNLSFRAHRYDYGTFHTNKSESNTDNTSTGTEVALAPNLIKIGQNISDKKIHTGVWHWNEGNGLKTAMSFKNRSDFTNKNQHTYYFKANGEIDPKSLGSGYAEGEMEGSEVLQPRYVSGADELYQRIGSALKSNNGNVNSSLFKKQNKNRNTLISCLTAEERSRLVRARLIANDKGATTDKYTIKNTGSSFSKTMTSKNIYSYTKQNALPANGLKRSHISMMNVLTQDGQRYEYGIPVKELKKKEVSFNVTDNGFTASNGLIEYNVGTDDKKTNSRGRDHFFSSITTPAYNSSFLLTGVYSPDYIDVEQDGPTPDDYGNYTKFNYTKHENTNWRLPVESGKGFFSKGRESGTLGDDKASYLYGEKENWYLHSIETKNYVVEFHLIDRKDALSIAGESGGVDNSKKAKALDRIKIFARAALEQNSNAAPVKEIKFTYDYTLCPGSPDSEAIGKGKLTLKGVEFFDYNSAKGDYRPYKFYYGIDLATGSPDPLKNPIFSYINKDSWGNYQLKDVDYVNLNNEYFPFVNQQTKTNGAFKADLHAQAWNLNRIETPMGSKLDIYYEADDYAYIQDRKAMQMIPIIGFNASSSNVEVTDRVIVDLSQYVSSSTTLTIEDIKDRFFKKESGEFMEYLQYSMKTRIKIINSSKDSPEFIKSYAKIDVNGIQFVQGNKSRITIPLVREQNSVYPAIRFQAMQVAKNEMQPLVMPGYHSTTIVNDMINISVNNAVNDAINIGNSAIQTVLSLANSILAQFQIARKGLYGYLASQNVGQDIVPNQSYVRLHCPSMRKKGGGHRVKKIIVTDNWADMASTNSVTHQDQQYGVEFDYTTTWKQKKTKVDHVAQHDLKTNLSGALHSSGVASYEPIRGGEENPHRETNNEMLKALPGAYQRVDNRYLEFPIGEEFMPSPMVVYSKVTTKAIQKTGVTKNRNGISIKTFYTNKDYPFEFKCSEIDRRESNIKDDISMFDFHRRFSFTALQGFHFIQNDMHGKPKSATIKGENGKLVSETSWEYALELIDGPNAPLKLVEEDGTIVSARNYNHEVDVVSDCLESKALDKEKDQEFNLDLFLVGLPFPIPVPTYFRYVTSDFKLFRSHAITKRTKQYGVLVKTTSTYLGATTSTRNWLLANTGQPVISNVTNPLDQTKPLLNYNVPAYWRYNRLGRASDNIDVLLEETGVNSQNIVSATTGKVGPVNQHYLIHGDEVLLSVEDVTDSSNNKYYKLWVIQKKDADGVISKYLIDKIGNTFSLRGDLTTNFKTSLKVIRSGNKNQLSATIGSFLAKGDVTEFDDNQFLKDQNVANKDVLSMSALELNDNWQAVGRPVTNTENVGCKKVNGLLLSNYYVNPFLTGASGVWRPWKSYQYNGKKAYGVAASTGIRPINLKQDAKLIAPDLFWEFNSANNLEKNAGEDWVMNAVVKKYHPTGLPMESTDFHDLSAAAIPGYGNTRVVAIAQDAKMNEVFFDNMEEGKFLKSGWSGYSLANKNIHLWSGGDLETGNAHTGKYARKVVDGANASIATVMLAPIAHEPKEYKANSGGYLIEKYELTNHFAPDQQATNQDYLVSFWVKRAGTGLEDWTYNAQNCFDLELDCARQENVVEKVSETALIDGWKLVKLKVTISGSTADSRAVKFVFKHPSVFDTDAMYLDDVKIQPFESEVVGSVYDPLLGRMVAEIGTENFATIYEYNEAGELVRVKQETVKGVRTISETRSSTRKNN